MKNTLSRTGNFFSPCQQKFTIFFHVKKKNPLDCKVQALMHADIDSDADADFYSDDDADIDSDVDTDIDAVVDQFSPVLQIFIASCPWAICLCLNS